MSNRVPKPRRDAYIVKAAESSPREVTPKLRPPGSWPEPTQRDRELVSEIRRLRDGAA